MKNIIANRIVIADPEAIYELAQAHKMCRLFNKKLYASDFAYKKIMNSWLSATLKSCELIKTGVAQIDHELQSLNVDPVREELRRVINQVYEYEDAHEYAILVRNTCGHLLNDDKSPIKLITESIL